MATDDRIMSSTKGRPHPVASRRTARGWSQSELARRSGLPRTSVGAIEAERLAPSVTTALTLARVLECSVEELFGSAVRARDAESSEWAWQPRATPCRFWEAEAGGRRWMYPAEASGPLATRHDGVWRGGATAGVSVREAETTLVLACCDPAAGLLAAEYARATGFRLLVFSMGGGAALDLLKRGAVHVAGLHRSTGDDPDANAATVRERLGAGYRMLRAAQWQGGLVVRSDGPASSVRAVVRQKRRWAMRETGAAARECLDQLADGRKISGRVVHSHAAVAEAVRAGWADAGVCVRLAAEEAGLRFLPVRTETLDFCFPNALAHDPRLQALTTLLRSRAHRRLLGELPGYDARETGELIPL